MAYDVLKFEQCAHSDIKTQPAKQQILCLKTANDLNEHPLALLNAKTS